MEFQSYVSWISSPVQIAVLDLVLGADNAVIIALVCRTLPRHQRLNVMIVGTGAALLLRIVLTALTGALMFAPLLRLVGGFVLILIAISLTDELDVGPVKAPQQAGGDGTPRDKQAESEIFWDAILLVVLADGVMSLDNTVALAAVAKGDVIYLILGLALSVPTLVFGSWLLSEFLGQTPILAGVAMAVLAWVAGDMAVSDPLIADWIQTTAPALTFGVPIAAVTFVLAKVAFKPVTVPLPVTGPFDLIEPGDDLGPGVPELAIVAPVMTAFVTVKDVSEEVAEPAALMPPQADATTIEPGGASDALDTSEREPMMAPDPSGAILAPEADSADEATPKRSFEERLVVFGLILLFGVAAVIMSAAIYFGGATF